MVELYRDRYIVYEILSSHEINSIYAIKETVWKTYGVLFGVTESADAGLFFSEYDHKKQIGMVRATHKSIKKLFSCFAFITNINGNEIIIRVHYTSGLIKKAKRVLNELIDDPNTEKKFD